MSNKNKHVIISYFPTREDAVDAAKQLKKWDKANKDIKLGGIGVLTWRKNKIKTQKVGARAGGSGAKWGIALGAVTGILSGGVTLIGGAIAGAVGGGVLGALFHKNLGLSDADKERLEEHLKGGGAAVVVMSDEVEVYPTSAELTRLGGKVEHFQVPEETMEVVEKSSAVEPIAEEELLVVTAARGGLRTVEGIGPAREAALANAGITTKQALLASGATPAGRAEIAEKSQISEKLIASWVSAIDLSRVKGIGTQYGELLQAAGVGTVGELAKQDAASLYERLVAVNTARNLVRDVPGASKIESWITQAKDLPEMVAN